jgi:hypothetical protein
MLIEYQDISLTKHKVCSDMSPLSRLVYSLNKGQIYLVTEQITGLTDTNSVYWRVERPTLLAWGHTTITYVNANNFQDQRQFDIEKNEPAPNFPFSTTGAKVDQTLNDGNHTQSKTIQAAVSKNETVYQLQQRASSNVNGDPFLDKYSLNWQGYGDDPDGPCVNKVLPPLYAPGE